VAVDVDVNVEFACEFLCILSNPLGHCLLAQPTCVIAGKALINHGTSHARIHGPRSLDMVLGHTEDNT